MTEPAQKRRRLHPGLDAAMDEMERLQKDNLFLTRENNNLNFDISELKKINKIKQSELNKANSKLTTMAKDHKVDIWDKADEIEDLKTKLEASERRNKEMEELRFKNKLLEGEVGRLEQMVEEFENTAPNPTAQVAEAARRVLIKARKAAPQTASKNPTVVVDLTSPLPSPMKPKATPKPELTPQTARQGHIPFEKSMLINVRQDLGNGIESSEHKTFIDTFVDKMLSPHRENDIRDLVTEYQNIPKPDPIVMPAVNEDMPPSLQSLIRFRSYVMYPHLYTLSMKNSQFYAMHSWLYKMSFLKFYQIAKEQKEVEDYIRKGTSRDQKPVDVHAYLIKGLEKDFLKTILDCKILTRLVSRCSHGILVLIQHEDMNVFRRLDLKALEDVCDLLLGATDLHLRRYCRLLQQCILEPIIHRRYVGLSLPADDSNRPIMEVMEGMVPIALVVKLKYPKGAVFPQKSQSSTPRTPQLNDGRLLPITPLSIPLRR